MLKHFTEKNLRRRLSGLSAQTQMNSKLKVFIKLAYVAIVIVSVSVFAFKFNRGNVRSVAGVKRADLTARQAFQQPALSALQTVERPYLPSLEARENTEFLLTVPILIEQSLNTNSIILYPGD